MRDDCSLVINTSCKSFSSNLALVLLIEVQEHLYLYEIRLEEVKNLIYFTDRMVLHNTELITQDKAHIHSRILVIITATYLPFFAILWNAAIFWASFRSHHVLLRARLDHCDGVGGRLGHYLLQLQESNCLSDDPRPATLASFRKLFLLDWW